MVLDIRLEFRLEDIPRLIPQLRLVLLDPKTHIALWTFSEGIPLGMKKTRDKNFDIAINNLVSDLKALTSQPAGANAAK